eukprot:c28644_g2_i1 orf=293-2242(+)
MMEVGNDALFVGKDAEINDCDKHAKKKLARKLAAYISAGKRNVAQSQTGKRVKVEQSGLERRPKGSVVYSWFASDVYGWPTKNLPVDVSNFRKSGIPSRFMYYDEAEWKDFSKDVTSILCEHFRCGKNFAELSIKGRTYLVNFMLMMQWNQRTGSLRSIAWIDENGKCFFPSLLFEGNASQLLAQQGWTDHQLRLKLDTQVTGSHICRTFDCSDTNRKSEDNVSVDSLLGDCNRLQKTNTGLQLASGKSMHLKVGGETDAINVTQPKRLWDFPLLGDKLIKLEKGDQEYAVVANKFIAGLGMLITYTSVVGIYRDSHSSMNGQAKLQAFQKQEEIKRKMRGDANMRYAWHGTSKQGVSGIVLHGFGQPKMPKNGTVYGVGVYLAPEDYSHVSAVYSDVDENGEQHVVLCRVIMGNMEQVQPGSEQFHPSSEEYDTGVDNLLNPKRYIIWSTHMNTHILPQYIVSFKISPRWHDVMAALRGKQTSRWTPPVVLTRWGGQDGQVSEQCSNSEPKAEGSVPLSPCQIAKNTPLLTQSTQHPSSKSPRSPWMSFPMLFYILRPKLSPIDMITLQQHYVEFKAGRMPREVLIRNVRAAVGDRILADSIRCMQAQEKASHNLNTLESHFNPGPRSVVELDVDTQSVDLSSSSNHA